MRLREYSENIPKPMVKIGYRPILWNIMKYYAHFGHNDFILCLGYKADVIKNYFVNYNEYISNDFIIEKGASKPKLLNEDIHDWKITFVDTGLNSNIGERLRLVKEHLEGEEIFLANYSDGLTDLPLPSMIKQFKKANKTAMFLACHPTQSFHVVKLKEDNQISGISHIKEAGLWINAGYFILRNEIFDYINPGEELVEEPFQRLIEKGKICAYPYNGSWFTMDTFKEKQKLDDMYSAGNVPWEVWNYKKRNKKNYTYLSA